ncbi:MAG: hemerythrin domain-containing protein [Myxococcota bacterium]
MRPTEILSNEHRVIEQVLSALEAMAKRSKDKGKLDKGLAGEAIDFLRNFADRCHHKKEEDLLFKRMEERGFPRNGGPTGVMLEEHEIGRGYIRAMSEALEGAAKGDKTNLKQFVQNAEDYVALLRSHIQKEDQILYPMADRVFSESDQNSLAESFDRVEKEDMGSGTHEKYHAIADKLAEEFGVPKAQETPAHTHEHFHHCC